MTTTAPVTAKCVTGTPLPYEAQGRHLMLTLSGCPGELLDNEDFLLAVTERAAQATGAQVLQVSSHHFQPQGVTALILLAESHASIHTYPEVGVAFWDCFTCGDECVPERSIDVLVEALTPAVVQWDCITRK